MTMFRRSLGPTGPRRSALSTAIAALGTGAFVGIGCWTERDGVPSPEWPVGTLIMVLIVVLILTAIGVASGLISGRFRDAPATWVAAVITYGLAYQVLYTVDPNRPTGDSGFAGAVLYSAVVLVPFIAGGHLLGVGTQLALRPGPTRWILVTTPLLLVFAGIAGCTAIALNSSPHADGYRPASTADIKAALNLTGLPTQIGDFELKDTSTYDSATAGRAYYATWSSGSKRQIQVVLNQGVPNCGSEDGFTDGGGQAAFRLFENNGCLQVFAPDLPSLRAAVAAVRPALTAQLEAEIKNPTTPLPKPNPTA